MPGEHGYDNEEKERKQRIKKLKAKTSKMRLAITFHDKKPSMTDKTKPGDCATCGEAESWHKEYNPETGEGSVARHHEFVKKSKSN